MNFLLVLGYYKNGVMDSIWESYNINGGLSVKYDFTKKELLYFNPNEYLYDAKYIFLGSDEKVDTTESRSPIYLFGFDYIFNELARNIKYPHHAIENFKMGVVEVKFIIDKEGNVGDFRVEKPIGYGMDEEAVRVLKNLPKYWLPGIENGKVVATEFIFPIKFTLQ